jgi:CO/xanthine dehydrogenase FAD-binding subunit
VRAFAYRRPETLAEALALLDEYGTDARVLAGGTDLVIRLRDRSLTPTVVVDIKRIVELAPSITDVNGWLRISAGTTMTDVTTDAKVRRAFPALADAASIIGSVQIRNRATLVGNQCNASPAADTAPVMLVFGAVLVVASLAGERRVALDDFFVRSGVTTLAPGELVTAVEMPLPQLPVGSGFQRRTRRRGHDLASVTMAASVDAGGRVRMAYGSLGPRPWVFSSDGGEPPVEEWFARAEPSATSMRASPDYRLAMLRVLGERALTSARSRLEAATA